MDYKEKYEEALEKARVWKEKSGMPIDRQGILDDIFPELKESEDEKIRKEIIALFQGKIAFPSTETIKKYIAWLEKQGEQKSTWSEEDERNLEGIINEIEANKNNAPDYDLATYDMFLSLLKSLKDRVQPQPKQEWSEEEKARIDKIIDVLDWEEKKGHIRYSDWEDYVCYVKSLKERYTWKPTDEQMKQLGWVAVQIKDNMIGKELMTLYNDLKKLREE